MNYIRSEDVSSNCIETRFVPFHYFSPDTKTLCRKRHFFRYTELFEMIVGVLTTCHTQYT